MSVSWASALQAEMWETTQQRAKRNLPFQAGRWCPHAKVNPFAKGEMPIFLPGDIQGIWFGKCLTVTVRCGQGNQHLIATTDQFAAQENIDTGPTRCSEHQRATIAEELFYRRFDQRGMLLEQCHLIGVL